MQLFPLCTGFQINGIKSATQEEMAKQRIVMFMEAEIYSTHTHQCTGFTMDVVVTKLHSAFTFHKNKTRQIQILEQIPNIGGTLNQQGVLQLFRG